MSNMKGWFGEKQLQFGFWVMLNKNKYKRLHNLIVPTANGKTQIDHVYMSQVGIFVIETKNFEGWIFADEKSKQWMQMFPNRKKFKFQNPLHQNYKHTKAISDVLAIDHKLVHSIVVFAGEGVFKTKVPPNVFRSVGDAARYIKKFNEVVFSDEQLRQIKNNLDSRHDMQASNSEHVHELINRYGQTDNCPKCGSIMVAKMSKQGKYKGNTFMACSGYPKCRYILNDAIKK